MSSLIMLDQSFNASINRNDVFSLELKMFFLELMFPQFDNVLALELTAFT